MNKSQIVFLSTFPPRACGIATFTEDMMTSIDSLSKNIESKVIAMHEDTDVVYDYSDKVIGQIYHSNKDTYIENAKMLNELDNVELVSIQHEFGIFGGQDGEYILDFMDTVIKPITTTFHTVLISPSEHQKEVVSKIVLKSSLIFVMTQRSLDILVNTYGADIKKIKIVPHGIHPVPYIQSDEIKDKFGLSGNIVLSTFGLLSSGKGVNYALNALPEVIKKYPNIKYLIIGATHPVILKREGEVYRDSLIKIVEELGLQNNVIFYNKFVTTKELLEYLQATDIYLSVIQDPNQTVSGTLSYALGVGRPVVATSSMYAKEIVENCTGRLVGFGESDSIKDALLEILSQEGIVKSMGQKAYFNTRIMLWNNVARSYMRGFLSIVENLNHKESISPEINISHIEKLTDDFGMFQFSKINDVDKDFGYTVDDNARALMAISKYYKKNQNEKVYKLIDTYINFLKFTSSNPKGFYNYVNTDKSFCIDRNGKENLEDANSRALYSLSFVTSCDYLPLELRQKADEIFKVKFDVNHNIKSPRAIAFSIMAMCYQDGYIDDIFKKADLLISLNEKSRSDGWEWFEESITYSNGTLSDALFFAYEKTQDKKYLDVALKTLNFLIEHSYQDDICSPVGQKGWLKKGGVKALYDQQPEEVSALIIVLSHAYNITKDKKYLLKMKQAYNWFLGENILGQVIYDENTGGCYDGLCEGYINLNQGAESTVLYLLARYAKETTMSIE